jgi:hypothetical protein
VEEWPMWCAAFWGDALELQQIDNGGKSLIER